MPAELHTVAGKQEDKQYIPTKFLKKEAINVHKFECSAVSSLIGIKDFFFGTQWVETSVRNINASRLLVQTQKLPTNSRTSAES